jgi:septum formation protein
MGLWLADAPLVLASRSESRRTVLAAAGIAVEVLAADVDERAIEAQAGAASPSEVALLLARYKALAVTAQRPGRLVLGADQTLALGQRLYAKPADLAAARDQLRGMRGRTHELHSAVVVARDRAVLFEHCEIARLTMREFSDDFLDRYLAAAGSVVTASVGGYQVESLGIQLFERIEGDHFTILGLPLLRLLQYLRDARCLAD